MTSGRERVPFLSSAWSAMARSLFEPVRISADRSCRVQFEASGTRWYLSVAGGRVADWQVGSVDEPDVELRWHMEDARRIIGRELRGDAALHATTVVAETGHGTYIGPPAPLNLASRPELASLPVVPDATLSVQYLYRAGPFGDVSHVLRFEDGRLIEERLGQIATADVVVDVTYRAMAQVRAGEISIIEALEGGSVTGDIGPLATLAGILESPEFHAAERATGPHALALAILGELDSDPTFIAAMKQVAACTQ